MFIYNKKTIDFDDPFFDDVIVFDEKTKTFKDVITKEDLQNAKQKKADELVKQGVLELQKVTTRANVKTNDEAELEAELEKEELENKSKK